MLVAGLLATHHSLLTRYSLLAAGLLVGGVFALRGWRARARGVGRRETPATVAVQRLNIMSAALHNESQSAAASVRLQGHGT